MTEILRDIDQLLTRHGYANEHGPGWVPDTENIHGIQEGRVTCPACDNHGYWTSIWYTKNRKQSAVLTFCQECGWQEITIELPPRSG